MDIIIVLLAILQSIGVSLGVGSSTLAITNFFVAIADGHIDPAERKMMGVVYIVLRVAMVLILLTTFALHAIMYGLHGTAFFIPYFVAFWILIGILFVNAGLMTAHVMPSTVGPALQAASWYTLGIMLAMYSLDLYGFSLLHFSLTYGVIILLAVSIVNGIMAWQKRKQHTQVEE